MTKPKNPKIQKLTAAALVAAATAETIRYNTRLNPTWSPPDNHDDMRLPIGEYVLEVHDLRSVAAVMGGAQALDLEPVWDLDPDLRRGAKPIFRRAIKGVIAHAERGMRQQGWKQVANYIGRTHHGGATWVTRNGEQVTLQVCVQPQLPAALLEDEHPEPSRKVDHLDHLPWPRSGTRVHLVIKPQDANRTAGYHRLTECLASALWRLDDTPEIRPPACEDIVLSEVRSRGIRWATELSEVYFRRENEGGMLPVALRTQLNDLRGKVVFHEVCAPRLDSVKVSQGSMLRPDGQWITVRYEKVASDDFGLPELEPGEVQLVRPEMCLGCRGTPTVTRVAPGEIIPEHALHRLMRMPKWHAERMLSKAVLNSVRWEMEDREGA